jgi:hypothetical protein
MFLASKAGQMRVHKVAFDLATEIERFAEIYACTARLRRA